MYLGQQVYFRINRILKIGSITEEIGDDLIISCDDVLYTVKAWQIRKVENEKKDK